MFKIFARKASILFVFGLILGCGCGKDKLFADRKEMMKEHKSMIEKDFNEGFKSAKKSENKCDALKKLSYEYEFYAEMTEDFEKQIEDKRNKIEKETDCGKKSYKLDILKDLDASGKAHKEMLSEFNGKIEKEKKDSKCE